MCWERRGHPNIAHCTNGAWKSSTHRSKWAFIHRQPFHMATELDSSILSIGAMASIDRTCKVTFTSLLIACNEIYMHHYFEFNSPLVSNGVARHCRLPFDWITLFFYRAFAWMISTHFMYHSRRMNKPKSLRKYLVAMWRFVEKVPRTRHFIRSYAKWHLQKQ